MKWHRIFFWALLLLLPTQLGLHFWPEWAAVLGRRVDYLSPTLYLTDIFIVSTLVSWLFFTHFVIPASEPGSIYQVLKKAGFRVKPGMTVTILAVLLFIFVNIYFAANKPVAIYSWLKASEFVLLGWYIVRTRPSFSTIITPLSIGVLYSSLLTIAQFILQHSVGGPLWWLGERTFAVDTPGIAHFDFNFSLFTFHFSLFGLRPYATFPHPNVLGGFLAAVLPLIVLRYLRILGNLRKKRTYFYGSVLAVGVIALFLTFSRSAIVVGAVGMGISIWYRVFRKKSYRIFPTILYALPFILLIVSAVWSFSPKEESVVVRQQLNAAAFHLWQSSPLFGVGAGNFLVRLPEALPTRTIYFLQPVHNIYLLLLSEIGVVGIGLILLWIVLQSQKWRVYSVKKKTTLSPLFTFHFSLFTLLLLGLVDHYPLTLQQGQLLFTVLAGMSLASVH